MITVPTKHLKAALLVAGKHDIRHYLNGVMIEASAAETRCVGLNGVAAAVLRHAVINEFIGEFIVPRDVVEAAIKAKLTDTVFEQLDAKHWMVNGAHRFAPVDGKFPSYRRVMPTQCSGQGGRGFSPEQFALFGKIAQALGKDPASVTTHSNGGGTAAITIEDCPDFAGVIMPLNFTKAMGDNGLGVQGWAAQ